MKYIYILPILGLIFFGCTSQNTKKKIIEKTEKKTQIKKVKNTQTISLNDINLTFKNNKLIYPKNKTVLLFEDNSTASKMQEIILKKLNTKFKKTDNPFLKEFFHIKTFPTIVVLENNKTIKYENFVPYQILKAEGF
jgi:hypothetical protein